MKFSITRENIFRLLKKINNITFNNLESNEKNIIIYIFNNYLYIIGNNDEIEINLKTNLNSNACNSDIIYISYKKIYNICKNITLNTLIEIYSKKNFLFIKTNKSLFSILIYKYKKINLFILKNKIIEICLNKNNILNLIKNTYFSISSNDVRVQLNCMFFKIEKNKIITISTDGHRLSTSKIFINNNYKEYKFILYKSFINEIIKFLYDKNDFKISLSIYKNFISIKNENDKIISRIVNLDYPDCNNIINKIYKYEVLINRKEFKESIIRISSILDEKSYLIILSFNKDYILIYSKNSNNEFSKEKIYIKYNGLNTNIGINYNYIIDILSILENENIIIKFNDNKSSLEISEHELNDKKYILMPIKI